MRLPIVLCGWVVVSSAWGVTKVDPAVNQALEDADRVRVIVVTRPDPSAPYGGLSGASSAEYIAGSLGLGAEHVQPIGGLTAVSADVAIGDVARLAADPNVALVVRDMPVPPTLYETVQATHATQMHAKGFNGDGLSVAVLDTGVDTAHPALRDKIVAEACFSVGGIPQPGIKSLCPNNLDVQVMKGAATGCPTDVPGCGHGTHVAGIIAGVTMESDGKTFSSVAPAAGIVAVQVFTRFENKSDCKDRPAPCVLSYTSDQLRALEWLRRVGENLKVASVNMSLGGGVHDKACDTTNPLTETIERLRSRGVPTVIAAGNDSLYYAVNSPACISSAVTVAATDRAGAVATYSNVASLVDFAAPGTQILSTYPGGTYARLSGTSMAAPHVAGALALLRQKMPLASALQLEEALRASSIGVPDPRTGEIVMRMDFGSDVAGSVADVAVPGPLAVPSVVITDDPGNVTGLSSQRFILRQAGSGENMSTQAIAGLLDKECGASSCEVKQVGEGAWVVNMESRDGDTTDRHRVEAMIGRLDVRVFDDELSGSLQVEGEQ